MTVDDPHPRDEEISEEEAHRLLARAVELDATRAGHFSISQLRDVARDAGISPRAFDEALSESMRRSSLSRAGTRLNVATGEDAARSVPQKLWSQLRGVLRSPLETAERWGARLSVNALVVSGAFIVVRYGGRMVSMLTHGSSFPVIVSAITLPLLCAGLALRLRARLAAAVLAAVGVSHLVGFTLLELGVAPRTIPGTTLGWLALTAAALGGIGLGVLIAKRAGTSREGLDPELPTSTERVSASARVTPYESLRHATLGLRRSQDQGVGRQNVSVAQAGMRFAWH